MRKPRVFVGSSEEAKAVAHAIQEGIGDVAETKVWDEEGVFELSRATLEGLEHVLPTYDFAVLVLSADDFLAFRGQEFAAPRDNLLFELGLFMGRLGRERTFFVVEKGDAELKLPSDLHGITAATFTRSPAGLEVGTAADAIRKEISERGSRPVTATPRVAEVLPDTLRFEALAREYEDTLQRLERDVGGVLAEIVKDGDLQRLRDGLYAGALFVARAAPTGFVDAAVYGSLMEIERPADVLRVRYSAGPYNEEIITRRFPLRGKGRGVAGEALATGVLQLRNDMAQELKVPGEARLQALASVPVEAIGECEHGTIAVLNIDCAVVNPFPPVSSEAYPPFLDRLGRAATIVRRINRLAR